MTIVFMYGYERYKSATLQTSQPELHNQITCHYSISLFHLKYPIHSTDTGLQFASLPE